MIQKTIRNNQNNQKSFLDESKLGRISLGEWSDENSQRLFSARMELSRGIHFKHLFLIISHNLSFPC